MVKKVSSVAPQHRDKIDPVKVPTPQFIKTLEEWEQISVVIQPADIFLLERNLDTGDIRIKVSDGIHKYDELPYVVDSTINDTLLNLLVNANKSGGVVVLEGDDTPTIPERFLPIIYTGRVKIADTFNEMILRGEDEETGTKYKQGPVIVIDASDDPSGTVQSGGAYYVWVEELATPAWVKISEFYEPEITLTEYFKHTGDDANTIGDISDDVYDDEIPDTDQYLKFSYADRTKLNSVVDTSDTISVKYTHAIFCTELNLASYSQISEL